MNDDDHTRRTREPKVLGEVLGRVLRRMKVSDDTSAIGLFSGWRSIVGDTIADNVSPKKLEKRVLHVETIDAAWATQLKFLERELISTLRQHGIDDVDSLEIRVRRSR